MFIARKGDTTTLGAEGPVKLKNPFPQPFYTTRGASRAPFFKLAALAATTTLGLKGRQT